ncbi:MAG: NFACT family protein, partial [Thermococcus sp.]|nr:NFACT family protein [Thermococcus sp.]
MKEEMSSVDIRYVVRELQWLLGSRVDKVYHDGDEIRIKLRTKEGRADLILQAGKRFHLTSYVKEAPKQPSSFTMLLRKHLGGGFIDAIEQHQFDRIVKIKVGDYTLIGELFRRGNIILVDSENRIVAALRYEEYKDRTIKPKAEYKFPPARENPLEVSFERFLELMREEEELELVRALARKLNMGGMYAEEISLRAGFEKTTPVKELSDDDLKRVYEAMMKTFNDEPRPNIVYKDGNMHDVVPIELKIYEGLEKRYFKTFSEALDEYFGKLTIEKAKIEQTKNLESKKRGLLATLRKQEEMLKGFEKAMNENQEIGDLIYANYALVEKLLE